MKTMFDRETALEIKLRVSNLRATSQPLWGEMNAGQAMAHCAAAMETALGTRTAPRMLMGRVNGGFIKPMVLGSDTPMRKNSPTTKDLIVRDKRNVEVEKKRLCNLIDQFTSQSNLGHMQHRHAFFGRLTPEEWSILAYKHLDHHLRQFGV
jgi:hypothetical protein